METGTQCPAMPDCWIVDNNSIDAAAENILIITTPPSKASFLLNTFNSSLHQHTTPQRSPWLIHASGHNFRKFQSTSLLMLWLSNYAVIFCLVLWDNDKPLYDSYSSSCQCQYIISLIWTPCHNTKVDFPWSTFLIQCIVPWLRGPLWRLSKKERKLQYFLASAPHDEKIFV